MSSLGVVRSAPPDAAKNFLVYGDRQRSTECVARKWQCSSACQSRNGSSDAIVYSAFPMDAAALAEVSASPEKRFGRKLNLSTQLDESLIRGIRVVVGDEVLDTSVKARLEQMKAALIA